jgi:hypothetical protein
LIGANVQISHNTPAGPVANAYEQSRARVSTIVGPTGGGKTVSSAKKCLRVAQWQHPSPRDGIRKAKICCITTTYRQAWRTVIPSYRAVMKPLGVLEKPYGLWTGAKDGPAKHVFDLVVPSLRDPTSPFEAGRRGQIHLEVEFAALGEETLEEFLRGYEPTAFWIPEKDTMPRDLIELALNRVGRYPPPDDRPAMADEVAYMGVFGDANVPDIDTWFYEDFYLPAQRKEGWSLFRQPPAILMDGRQNPEAENLQNLLKINPQYYAVMAKDMAKWAVRRFLGCKPGYSRHGIPVHEHFDDDRHVSKVSLTADPYAELVIGMDGGGNTNRPAATFMQEVGGRIRILADYAPDSNTSAQEAGKMVRQILNTKVKRARGAVIVIDPAAAVVSPLSPYTYAQQVQMASGIEVRLAQSNDPKLRRGGLAGVLEPFPQGQPKILIDPDCSDLIRALAGGFHYRKKDKDRGVDVPVKNQHSHVAESAEYGVLGIQGLDGFFAPVAGNADFSSDNSDLYMEPIL